MKRCRHTAVSISPPRFPPVARRLAYSATNMAHMFMVGGPGSKGRSSGCGSRTKASPNCSPLAKAIALSSAKRLLATCVNGICYMSTYNHRSCRRC